MNAKQTKMICGLYCRVSTRQQLETEYNSIESQRERLQEYCKFQDYEVFKVYEDGGKSAQTLDRPELQELIRDILCGNINCVIVYKIDRISRSMGDFYKLYELFEEHGVKFISMSENFDASSSIGRLSLNMSMGFAQYARELDGDRIRDKLEQRARKGMWHGGRLPYGFTSENSRLIVIPHEAECVRFIFEEYAAKASISHIRHELHLRGWYTKQGNKWSKSVIGHLLKNDIYIGMIKHNGKRYQGIHEPIISKELFQKVQSMQPDRSHVKARTNRTYVLKGLLRCGHCEKYLTPNYTRKTKKDGTKYNIPYYRCTTTAHHSFGECEVKSINANKIETQVISYLEKLSDNKEILKMVENELNKDQHNSITPLQEKKRQIEKRIDNINSEIMNIVDALALGSISKEFLEKAIAERKANLEELKFKFEEVSEEIKTQLNKPFDVSPLHESIVNFSNILDHLTPKEKAEALQCMIQSIEVHPDRMILNLYEIQNDFSGSKNRFHWWS